LDFGADLFCAGKTQLCIATPYAPCSIHPATELEEVFAHCRIHALTIWLSDRHGSGCTWCESAWQIDPGTRREQLLHQQEVRGSSPSKPRPTSRNDFYLATDCRAARRSGANRADGINRRRFSHPIPKFGRFGSDDIASAAFPLPASTTRPAMIVDE